MNTWLDIKEIQPAVGDTVLVQTVANDITIWKRVRHGSTRKLAWHNGSRYMDNEMVKYWQPLPELHCPVLPFSLEAALEHKQCVTRDGRSVWLVGVIPEQFTKHHELLNQYPLMGYVGDNSAYQFKRWTTDGVFYEDRESALDLVGVKR